MSGSLLARDSGALNALRPHAILAVRVGVWRSLVAHLHGVQGVAGSNPVTPTIFDVHVCRTMHYAVCVKAWQL